MLYVEVEPGVEYELQITYLLPMVDTDNFVQFGGPECIEFQLQLMYVDTILK